MYLVDDSSIILDKISLIKSQNKSFITNYFWSATWLSAQVLARKISIIECSNSFFLFFQKEGFLNLYFFSLDSGTLEKDLKCLEFPDIIVIVEIVEKNNSLESVKKIFTNDRFKYYSKLTRVSNRLKNISYIKEMPKNITFAEISDINGILELQHKHFNKYVDRYLTYEELIPLVEKQSILVGKEEDRVVGFFVFEFTKGISHLRSAFVLKTCKDMFMGTNMFLLVFNICKNSKIVYGWLREDNINLFRFYKSFKFVEDGLTDTILYYDTLNSIIDPIIPLN